MALNIGFRPKRVQDCAWIGDPALAEVPEAAKADWRKDGAAAHLLPYAKNGELTIIKIRDLHASESRYMQRYIGAQVLVRNLFYECFALGARFKGQAEQQQMPDGSKAVSMVRDANGFLRLSDEVMDGLEVTYPGLIDFFGELIFTASFPTEAEKKASSLPSTGTLSLVAADTDPSTGAAQSEKAPAV